MGLKQRAGIVVALALVGPASGQIVIDGTRDADYGAALAVQTVQTGFGNATNPNGTGSGGELDAAYAVIQAGRLFVMITGNVEPNFNKLGVFIDSVPGGENVLSSAPEYDFENIGQNYGGLTFDAGFAADYHIYSRWGGGAYTFDIVNRAGGASAIVTGNGANADVGVGTGVQSGVVETGDLGLGSDGVGEVRDLVTFLTSDLPFAFNNTNIAGVGGSGGSAANQAAALAVTTGLEFSIRLVDLGDPAPGDAIKLHVVYGNSNNNFHSNQTLGGLPVGSGNLGGDGSGTFTGTLSGINFNSFAGDQFFTVFVPSLGDYDGDGDVDENDYESFADCTNGPNVAPAPASVTIESCLDTFDFDADGDVDAENFADFQTFFDAP